MAWKGLWCWRRIFETNSASFEGSSFGIASSSFSSGSTYGVSRVEERRRSKGMDRGERNNEA